MKTKQFRIKLVMAYLLSALLAGFCLLFLFLIICIIFRQKYAEILSWINENSLVLFSSVLLVFIIVMSAFFVLLTNSDVSYLEKITQVINKISSGNLGIQVTEIRSDELGKLSESVNTMSKELKRLNDERQNWEKAKDDLISNVSHDLRTPLTSILGYLQLITNGEKSCGDEAIMQYAEVAYSKSVELKYLVDELFEYSKVSNAELKLNCEKVDISELNRQVVLGLMPVFEENKLQCTMDFPSEPVYVFADAMLLARVFNNLICNAIKHSTDGKNIDIKITSDTEFAIIRVENSGEIIPASELPFIFDRYYRGEKSRSDGAGLGLAIVKSIVNKHEGKISVTSSDNKTIFEVKLKSV